MFLSGGEVKSRTSKVREVQFPPGLFKLGNCSRLKDS